MPEHMTHYGYQTTSARPNSTVDGPITSEPGPDDIVAEFGGGTSDGTPTRRGDSSPPFKDPRRGDQTESGGADMSYCPEDDEGYGGLIDSHVAVNAVAGIRRTTAPIDTATVPPNLMAPGNTGWDAAKVAPAVEFACSLATRCGRDPTASVATPSEHRSF